MQDAATVLDVYHKRGQRQLPIVDGYKRLYNTNLFLRAYVKLASNQGATTPGVTEETIDGMSIAKIHLIQDALKREVYRWSPSRRVYIPKPDGKRRALGLPTWSDKLVQEVIRSLLEAYYEPTFANSSHGFRPIRGADTALEHIRKTAHGCKWWVEGDIQSYFDTINHDTLLTILGRQIHDNRLLTLIRRFLAAGYMEDWKFEKNLSGTPQGGVLSPLLSNIYLNELDVYVETVLIPRHTRGKRRRVNPPYNTLASRRRYWQRKGDKAKVVTLTAQMRSLPSRDPNDPDFRRLSYVRYADDFLLGVIGPKEDALAIKTDLSNFLTDTLDLELNDTKTLVTHARNQPAKFLGYELQVQYANDFIGPTRGRSINGKVGLRVPRSVIYDHIKAYTRRGHPAPMPMLTPESPYSIVSWYQSRWRGLVQYYKPAWNVSTLWHLHWVMKISLLMTLGMKHSASMGRMWRKYRSTVPSESGPPLQCLEVIHNRFDEGKRPLVARFGGIPLRRDPTASIRDLTLPQYTDTRSELLQRLLADTCELCEITGVPIEIHHIRALKDLHVTGHRAKTPWERKMSAMSRKTLAVCGPCHKDITYGRHD